MLVLIAGLVLFLGVHSVRIVTETGRERWMSRLGEQRYKGVYSIVSLIGLIVLAYGYGIARQSAVAVYDPPAGLRHLALALVPIAFVLAAAAYAPPGHIKAAVRHPMVLGVALWAFAHLLANGTDADLVLFGAFFVWAVLDYVAAIRRTAGAGVGAELRQPARRHRGGRRRPRRRRDLHRRAAPVAVRRVASALTRRSAALSTARKIVRRRGRIGEGARFSGRLCRRRALPAEFRGRTTCPMRVMGPMRVME